MRGQPATLTDWLRSRDDAQLAALLNRRPDLALPAPADLPTLASRLSVRTSVQRAVDGLDGFTLPVLEALVLSAGADSWVKLPDTAPLLGRLDEGEITRAVTELLDIGLVWGALPAVHLVASVRESVGTYPAGLGRPAAILFRGVADVQLAPVLRAMGLPPTGQPRAGAAAADVLADPERLRALLADCDADERAVLERLAEGPPIGTVRSAQLPPPRDDQAPPHRLLTRGLLVAVDAQTVELPREVALALRPVPIGELQVTPPVIVATQREPAELDRAGGTAVLETLRLVEALAESWSVRPPAQLRAGGIGVRDLRRTARELGVDEPVLALVAEVANAAGLLNVTHELESTYLPTAEYDSWQRHNTASRWTELASAWLAMTRQPSLTSQRGDRDRIISVLGPDAERGTIPALRTQVLATLAQLPPGAAPVDRTAVLRRLAWQAPRRANGQRPIVQAILAEADLLGLTAAGGLTGYTRTLLDGSRAVAEHVLDDALPDPVDHFLVQPDLTIVVPGPPTAELARELTQLADLESTGGASVYRLTEATVRRALDSGRSGADLHRFISERSRTPAPQALTYLIDDCSKRHGALRTGVAAAYLRCDDEQLLTRVVNDRDLGNLQLHQIASTVAISPIPVARVLDGLRQAGYAPAAEAPDGGVIALGVDSVRAPSRPPLRPVRSRGGASTPQQLGEIVRRIRAGDNLTTISTRIPPITQQLPGVTSAATMGVLREAIRAGRQVLLNCAEPDGTATRHAIVPISMAGGYVRGHEPASQRLQSFPLHRLIAVSTMDQIPEEYPDSDDAS